jgi:threonine synthase
MTVLVSMAAAMKRRGRHVRALVCASTGDTSAALAAYGARAGLPVVVLLPAGKVSTAQLVQPIAAGARVLELDGDFDACMGVVAALAKRPGIFLANSKNPLRLEGQKTVAFEIARELGWRAPDFVLVPSGNLGNVAALYNGFATLLRLGLVDRLPRLVACQVDAANPLYVSYGASQSSSSQRFESLVAQTARDTHASAIRIGAPVSFPRAQKALRATDGIVTSVSEAALLEAAAHGDRAGLFVDPHTAVALASVAQVPDRARAVCVVVSTAHGLKFADQKTRFHEGSTALGDLPLPEDVRALRNPPRRLPASVDAVVEALG